jgi:Ca2+:H+ antiporter
VNSVTRKQRILLGGAVVTGVLSWGLTAAHAAPLFVFAVTAIALALLAQIIGEATDQLGRRLGPGATGLLQSALGNLPELFISLFALRAGLVTVVQTALIGSILSNSLLVLGLAFVVGGIKHGVQKFDRGPAQMISTLTLLAVAALALPSLTAVLHTPAEGHEAVLSAGVAILLLLVFLASIPFSLKGQGVAPAAPHGDPGEPAWSMGLTVGILAAAGVGAALVSDWFVNALEPAIEVLHVSQAFAGLVIVSIAGNAVENVVGIQLAAQNKPDYALSVILNSSLQVALALTPILVLLSFVVSPTPLTLVLPPLLVVVLFLTAIISTVVVFDGESNWLEGLILIALYAIIAASFWWG